MANWIDHITFLGFLSMTVLTVVFLSSEVEAVERFFGDIYNYSVSTYWIMLCFFSWQSKHLPGRNLELAPQIFQADWECGLFLNVYIVFWVPGC